MFVNKPILWMICSLLLLTGIAGVLLIRVADANVPPAIRHFAEDFRSIRQQPEEKAMTRMLSLFCWDNITTQHREAVIRSLYFELDIPIRAIRFRPWEAETDTPEFFPEPTTPNLRPQWVMIVHFDQKPRQTLSLPLGYDGQDWKIVNPEQKEV